MSIKNLSQNEIMEYLKSHNIHEVFSDYEFSNLVDEVNSITNGNYQEVEKFVRFLV